MLQVLRANLDVLIHMAIMALFWLVLNLRAIKGNIDAINLARQGKDLPQMSLEERQIVTKILRSSVLSDSASAFIAGIVALIVADWMI